MYSVKFQGNIVTNYKDIVSTSFEELRQNWEVFKDNVKQKLYFLEQGFVDKEYNPLITSSYYYVRFGVHDCPDFILQIEINSLMSEKNYVFLDDVYEGSEFNKISFIEKTGYIDVLSDVQDYKQILEKISQFCKNQPQYLFDKYGGVNVSFPPLPYKNLLFKLNNLSNVLDVFLHLKYFVVNGGGTTEKIEKLVSFKIYQSEFFELFWFGMFSCVKENQCNILSKNSVPVVVGGAGQYYSKSEIDSKLNEIKMLIRNISTLPEKSSSSVLTLDNQQFKALSSLLLLLGGK